MITRSGDRARFGSILVYRLVPARSGELPASRAGVIVGRAVGNSVARHRVSRLLRAELAACLPQGAGELIVVRALPGAAQCPRPQLRGDVAKGILRLRARDSQQGHDRVTAGRVTP